MNKLAYKLGAGLVAIVLMSTSPGAQQTASDPASQGTFLLTIFSNTISQKHSSKLMRS